MNAARRDFAINLRDRLSRAVRDCLDLGAPAFIRLEVEHQLARVVGILARWPASDDEAEAVMYGADSIWQQAHGGWLETKRRDLRRLERARKETA